MGSRAHIEWVSRADVNEGSEGDEAMEYALKKALALDQESVAWALGEEGYG